MRWLESTLIDSLYPIGKNNTYLYLELPANRKTVYWSIFEETRRIRNDMSGGKPMPLLRKTASSLT
jgi:hypothetical protein